MNIVVFSLNKTTIKCFNYFICKYKFSLETKAVYKPMGLQKCNDNFKVTKELVSTFAMTQFFHFSWSTKQGRARGITMAIHGFQKVKASIM